MMTMDYTFERRLELQREEAIEEGREEGMQKNFMNRFVKSCSRTNHWSRLQTSWRKHRV